MEQNLALQDGFNAILKHLESLEQCEPNKVRYVQAYGDISDYYELFNVIEYKADVNKAYRDNVKERSSSRRRGIITTPVFP